jgi:hypothetical protein
VSGLVEFGGKFVITTRQKAGIASIPQGRHSILDDDPEASPLAVRGTNTDIER